MAFVSTWKIVFGLKVTIGGDTVEEADFLEQSQNRIITAISTFTV
jgi:hypothetical protein